MPTPGRPKALAEEQRATVCSLVASGVSIRQAAHFVDCDPRTVRREAQSNEEFRHQLAKAKSEANVHPLQTLRQAAQSNWRAALCWMERLEPDRFARPNAAIVTQREANRFVAHLSQIIARTVSDPTERTDLLYLVTIAMPTAMRKRWDSFGGDEKLKQAILEVIELRTAEERTWNAALHDRDFRRRKLLSQIKQYVPDWLHEMLDQNSDAIDPKETFIATFESAMRERSAATRRRTDAHATSIPPNDAPTTSKRPDDDLPIPESIYDDVTNDASPQ